VATHLGVSPLYSASAIPNPALVPALQGSSPVDESDFVGSCKNREQSVPDFEISPPCLTYAGYVPIERYDRQLPDPPADSPLWRFMPLEFFSGRCIAGYLSQNPRRNRRRRSLRQAPDDRDDSQGHSRRMYTDSNSLDLSGYSERCPTKPQRVNGSAS